MPYWWSGFAKLLYFDAAVAEVSGLGQGHAPVVAAATITVELAGSALVIARRYGWLGAGALGVFTALATLAAHAFWTVDDPVERGRAVNSFLEHIALIAGFMLAAIVTRGPAPQRRTSSAIQDRMP